MPQIPATEHQYRYRPTIEGVPQDWTAPQNCTSNVIQLPDADIAVNDLEVWPQAYPAYVLRNTQPYTKSRFTPPPIITYPLTRQSTGLLLSDNFTTATGTGTGFTHISAPSMVCFDRSPLLANDSGVAQAAGHPPYLFAPGVDAGIDGDGARESTPFIDDDGTWYHYYGGYKVNEPWRILAMRSPDRGITWEKLGDVGLGLDKYDIGSSTPNGEKWGACDNLFTEKRNGFYYLHRLGAEGAYQNLSVPNPKYISEMFRGTTPLGPWTYVCRTAEAGSDPGYNERDTLVLSILEHEGEYLGFSCDVNPTPVVNGRGAYYTGLYIAQNYEGPWVRQPGPVLPPHLTNNNYLENPKVKYVPAIGKYVMFITMLSDAEGPYGQTNAVFVTDNPRDWSQATRMDVQQAGTPADGSTVNVPAFIHTPNGSHVDVNGYLPFAYDTDQIPITDAPPSATTDNTGGRLRNLAWACLEPSPAALRTGIADAPVFVENFDMTDGPLAGRNGWVLVPGSAASSPAVVNSNLALTSDSNEAVLVNTTIRVADGRVSATGNFSDNGVQLVARLLPNGHHLLCNFNTAGIGFYKFVGNGYELFGGHQGPPLNPGDTVALEVVGNTLYTYHNGVKNTEKAVLSDNSVNGAGDFGVRNVIQPLTLTSMSIQSLTPGSIGVANWHWPCAHSDMSSEYALAISSVAAPQNCYVGVEVRRQDSGNCYLVASIPGQRLQLLKVTNNGATGTPLQAGVGSETIGLQPRLGRVRIETVGNRLRAWLDGELQLDYTDGIEPYLSGTSIGVRSEGTSAEFRNLHIRTANTVTVNGLTTGQQVVLRMPGGPPLSIKTATDNTLTFGPADGVHHFPAGEISIDGSTSYAGLIYGGDVFIA